MHTVCVYGMTRFGFGCVPDTMLLGKTIRGCGGDRIGSRAREWQSIWVERCPGESPSVSLLARTAGQWQCGRVPHSPHAGPSVPSDNPPLKSQLLCLKAIYSANLGVHSIRPAPRFFFHICFHALVPKSQDPTADRSKPPKADRNPKSPEIVTAVPEKPRICRLPLRSCPSRPTPAIPHPGNQPARRQVPPMRNPAHRNPAPWTPSRSRNPRRRACPTENDLAPTNTSPTPIAGPRMEIPAAPPIAPPSDRQAHPRSKFRARSISLPSPKGRERIWM